MKETLQTLNTQEEALEHAISPIINNIIDKNFENSGEKIALQIAPLISSAIKEQIKNNKDEITDALYPVMGNMINKYITKSFEELLNKINTQIQNGLSARTIKRKIKSKLTGVDETQLLLEESTFAHIQAALLIHKESGTLLSKIEDHKKRLNDADMLASMMTAIRSFVNDWISNSEGNSELGEIEYGGNKIILEASGYSYLAVIIEGAAYAKTYKTIRQTMESITLDHAEAIKKFNGNLKDFPQEEITSKLATLLDSSQISSSSEKKKLHPLIILIPLIVSSYTTYTLYQKHVDSTLQTQIIEKIEHTPALSNYKIDVSVTDKVGTLRGSLPFQYHKDLLNDILNDIANIERIKNEVKVIPTLTDPMQVSSNIAYLVRGFNLNNKTNITYTFDYNIVTLQGSIKDLELKKSLISEIQNIQGIQKVVDDTDLLPEQKDILLHFNRGATTLTQLEKQKLLSTLKHFNDQSLECSIQLTAYSDMIRSELSNRLLAQKRIGYIRDFIKKNITVSHSIKEEIFNSPPPNVDVTKDPDQARCIKFQIKGQI